MNWFYKKAGFKSLLRANYFLSPHLLSSWHTSNVEARGCPQAGMSACRQAAGSLPAPNRALCRLRSFGRRDGVPHCSVVLQHEEQGMVRGGLIVSW